MKNRKFYFGILFIAILSVISVSIYAQGGPRGAYNNPDPQFCRYIPDLTEEQETKINELWVKHLDKVSDLRLDIDERYLQLARLEKADSPDSKAIDQKIDEIFELKKQQAKLRSKHQQQVRALLTDEQKIYFDTHWNHRMHGRKDHAPGRNSHDGFGRHAGYQR